MKHSVYSFTTELHNCGTETKVFATSAELYGELRGIMLDRINTPNMEWKQSEEEAIAFIREDLEKVDDERTLRAWQLFRNHDGNDNPLHHPEDCFWCDEHTLEIPLPDEPALPGFYGIFTEAGTRIGAGRNEVQAWENAQRWADRQGKGEDIDSERHYVEPITEAEYLDTI